ncbi:HlyD family transporter secretion protein [Legionella lansingensis]|uniref:HlyD family transporter secretion protein n=2 Tax=Legionella lansingensis TaxID=45067 RepID=A0A0W0W0H5_9GAMM|nr:HlyD family transporter secretion protein [Legionella lansingensis]
MLITGCHQDKQPTAPTPTVSAIKVVSSQIPIYKEYIGITQSIASVGIRARVEGFLTQMNFVEGKPVKKDQLLFVIDPKPFEAQLELAQGQLARSIADQEFQRVQFLRMKELVAKGDVSQSRYDEVRATYQEAEADVEVGRAKVEEAKINLSYCYMRSPIDGIIGERYVDVGNLVGGTKNTLLATVVKLDPMYVQFSPSVNDFGEFLKYRENVPFKVEVSLPQNKDLVFRGQVDLVNNQADVPTATILMRALIQNPEKLLLPGIYVDIKVILTEHGDVILIPSKAIMETQGEKSVYVINKENEVEVRTITTAAEYEDQSIVKSGLQIGDVIMTSGLQNVKPNQKVIIKMNGQ